MVKHMIFREYVDDHPRAGWSDHMDGLPCDRGGGQAAHSRQGWCYWHLRGGPFQDLDQPEIAICCAGVPQRHQRASRSRDWGRVGHREAYVPEVTMIIIMLILFLVMTTIVVMSLMISMKVCSTGGYCCNMGHQHCEWTIINVSSSPSSSSSSRTSAWSEPSSTGWKQWDCGPDKEGGTSSFCFHCWHVKQVIEVITMMIFILSWRRLDGNNVGNVNNGVGGGNGDKS